MIRDTTARKVGRFLYLAFILGMSGCTPAPKPPIAKPGPPSPFTINYDWDARSERGFHSDCVSIKSPVFSAKTEIVGLRGEGEQRIIDGKEYHGLVTSNAKDSFIIEAFVRGEKDRALILVED
jgi:hypothetical protein